MSRQTDNAAKAVRALVLKALDRVPRADYGLVRTVNPLAVEFGHENEVLDSDELVVTQAIRQYDKDVGLAVGDALALVPLETGEMVALGVISQTGLTAAPATASDVSAAIAAQAVVTSAAIAAAVAAAGAAAWSAGDFKPSGQSSAPTGWLMCDGSTVSRTTYAALFAAIGTDYNTGGEAGTDFRLPNGVGRAFIGAGTGTAGDATAHARGSYTGTETQDLTIANLPVHSHGGATSSTTPGVTGGPSTNTSDGSSIASTGAGTAHSHAPSVGQLFTSGTTPANPTDRLMAGNSGGTTAGIAVATGIIASEAAHTHPMSHTHTMGNHTHTSAPHTHPIVADGSGTKHNNMPPVFVGYWMVKT